jgi:hypothetical protein
MIDSNLVDFCIMFGMNLGMIIAIAAVIARRYKEETN